MKFELEIENAESYYRIKFNGKSYLANLEDGRTLIKVVAVVKNLVGKLIKN